MRTFFQVLLAIGLWAAAGSAAQAGVTVTFVTPESYGDMPWAADAKARVLQDLQEHLIKLGARLAPDQELKIEVLDLDLAGRMAIGRGGPREYRILVGGADWPTMRLRYSLASAGAVMRMGEERIANMNYLQRANRYGAGQPLRYEKQMIDDWFARRFPPAP